MSKRERAELKYCLEILFYMIVCMAVHGFLVYKHWFPYADLGFLWHWGIIYVTITIGRYVTDVSDGYFLKRKIRKLMIIHAKKKGISAKELDWKQSKIAIDKDGNVDVEVAIKDTKKKTTD